jgi:hypothetical protein
MTYLKCFRCEAAATGLYAHHSGSHDRACDIHRGVCHDGCWPAEARDERYQAVTR